jgi:hypothetical protein
MNKEQHEGDASNVPMQFDFKIKSEEDNIPPLGGKK